MKRIANDKSSAGVDKATAAELQKYAVARFTDSLPYLKGQLDSALKATSGPVRAKLQQASDLMQQAMDTLPDAKFKKSKPGGKPPELAHLSGAFRDTLMGGFAFPTGDNAKRLAPARELTVKAARALGEAELLALPAPFEGGKKSQTAKLTGDGARQAQPVASRVYDVKE